MKTEKYWWKDMPDIGVYDFCYNESKDYDFWLRDIPVSYNDRCGWSEEERQRRFGGARFMFGGCANGVSYSDVLKAKSIDEAKREFESWYENYLDERVELLNKQLAAATEECKLFSQYKKGV